MVSKSRKNNRARRSVKKGGAEAHAVFSEPARAYDNLELILKLDGIRTKFGKRDNTVKFLAKFELLGKINRAIREDVTFYDTHGVEARRSFKHLKILTIIEQNLEKAMGTEGWIKETSTCEENSKYLLEILDNLDQDFKSDDLIKDVDYRDSSSLDAVVARIQAIVDKIDSSNAFNCLITADSVLAAKNAQIGGTRKRRKSKKGGKRRKSHKR